MMHSPLFQMSPLFSTNFQIVENFQNSTFSRKISQFSSVKISDDLFLVIDHKFPPISPVSIHFTLFRENYYLPHTLKNVPPCFRKIHLLFTYFMCISFPPTLTMMHLCITRCTYWTPLAVLNKRPYS